MNKQRRKMLAEAIDLIMRANEIIEICKSEEEESLENLPEGIQCSDRGEQMEEYIDQMDECFGDLESVCEALDEICG